MPDHVVIVHHDLESKGVPPLLGIAMTVSQAEQDHIDAIRRRSYELAIARGHIRT